MSNVPQDLRYTREHEWARVEEGGVRIGITDYAQEQLGDVVYLNLPEVGTSVEGGAPCGEVESTKSVSDIYAPISGHVLQVNTEAIDNTGAVNQDPYGLGWLVLLEQADAAELDAMMTADEYTKFLQDEAGE